MKKEPEAFTPWQRGILEELEDYLSRLIEFDGISPEKMFEIRRDTGEAKFFKELEAKLIQTLRAGLHRHPLVEGRMKALLTFWVLFFRAFREKDLLRETDTGLEVGIKRGILKTEELNLLRQIEELRLGEEIPLMSEEDGLPLEQKPKRTFEEILQKVRKSRVFDTDNPSPQYKAKKPLPWRKVFKRLKINQTRQVFFKWLERLDPLTYFNLVKPKKSGKTNASHKAHFELSKKLIDRLGL